MHEPHDNLVAVPNEIKEDEFEYTFINTPWTDRSNKSKVSMILLLVSIFALTMGLVINNFFMHFRGMTSEDNAHVRLSGVNCQLVKIDDLKFVARIHLAASGMLICLAAVVGPRSVITSHLCIKIGPIRLRLGSQNLPRCKKGFLIDIIETIDHDGIISNKLAIISTYEKFEECATSMRIGREPDWNAPAFIVGRPTQYGRTLSHQSVNLVKKENCSFVGPSKVFKNLNIRNMICVKDLMQCPVQAGDLLIQNDILFGLAATSVHMKNPHRFAYFADLTIVNNEIEQISKSDF